MTDQEFLAASTEEPIEYAAGIGSGNPEDMDLREMGGWFDLHSKVRQLDPHERKAFLAGLAWDTKQLDRERGFATGLRVWRKPHWPGSTP